MSRCKIIAGKQYSKLIAIEPTTPNSNNKSRWIFACECGNQKIIVATKVISGQTKSCGCLRPYVKIDPATKQYRSIPNSAAREVWSAHYTDGCPFEAFLELSQCACHYCGSAPIGKRRDFTYNGLDRKDSSRDHSPDNIVPCCKHCNWFKGNTPYDTFLGRVERIHEYQKKKATELSLGSL